MAEKKERGAIRASRLYRRLSEPFASIAETNAALDAFNLGLRALRETHKLPDVYVVVSGTWLGEDGEECRFMVPTHHGDPMMAESMAAYAYGVERQQHSETVAELLQGRKAKP